MAMDCAFFFDFSSYLMQGSGRLLAYRTDLESKRDMPAWRPRLFRRLERFQETLPTHSLTMELAANQLKKTLWRALGDLELPPGNDDIARTTAGLDQFLWTIAKHAEVETDRAHVLIASAMLGKRAYYGQNNYHKVRAIVAYAFDGFPVIPLD